MEIGDIVVYFIKVIAIQGVLFTFYWLALRHRPNHALNRIFLLSTLLLSLVIPVIENPVPQRAEPMLDVVMLEWMSEPMEFVATEIQTSESSQFPIWNVVGILYFGLLIFFIGRSTFHLYLLQKIKKQCEYVKKHWFKLFKTTQSRPFSFFSSVFIPKEIFGTNSFDQILAHECVHVRQFHSLDRLLLDFLVSLFWFNPFIYLYRNALIEVHEYQADAEVVKKFNDLVGYQEILFAQLQPAPYSGLVSHFNFSTIKKRIVMMNKSKNEGQSRLTYMLTLPLIAMVLFAFTSKESTESVTHITDKIEALAGPFDVFPSINSLSQEDKYRPSILPLRADADFKMTSSFGMRQDPIDMKKKQHKGIDLAAAIGTEVIATAEGIVEELSSNPNGHGHMITLNH
ncbi:MAG: M56 family metallopeptidase, partial [Cyclobacteriaceae bacterium]